MTPSVTPFRSQLPVKIAFGDGTIALLPDALATLRAATALVVVEEPVAEHSGVTAALAASESGGVRLERVVKGPGEPTFALADELAARVRDGGLDAVVGIGGGSALDVAKAARIAADQGGATGEYASGARVPEPPRIGLVLCPTTSGTGSEVSGASVLTDTERDRKIGFGYPHMSAGSALVAAGAKRRDGTVGGLQRASSVSSGRSSTVFRNGSDSEGATDVLPHLERDSPHLPHGRNCARSRRPGGCTQQQHGGAIRLGCCGDRGEEAVQRSCGAVRVGRRSNLREAAGAQRSHRASGQ